MSESAPKDDPAVAARIQLLIENERRASEEMRERKRRRITRIGLAIFVPALLITLFALLRYLF